MKTDGYKFNEMNAKAKLPAAIEIVTILSLSVIVYVVSGYYDALESFVKFLHKYEDREIDEIIIVSVFLVFCLTIFTFRRWRMLIVLDRELMHRNSELQKAFEEIKRLKGIIPICSSCKKIRDDQGYWHQVESYIQDHTEAEFSHSVCPDCMKKLYPDFMDDNDEK